MSDLRPCPFCGHQEYLCTLAEGEKDDRQYTIVCDASGDGGCGASCGWQDTIAEAKAAWNRRSVRVSATRGWWNRRADMDGIDQNGAKHIHWQCSECGLIHDFIGGYTAQYKYCPQCGAEMGGGDAE